MWIGDRLFSFDQEGDRSQVPPLDTLFETLPAGGHGSRVLRYHFRVEQMWDVTDRTIEWAERAAFESLASFAVRTRLVRGWVGRPDWSHWLWTPLVADETLPVDLVGENWWDAPATADGAAEEPGSKSTDGCTEDGVPPRLGQTVCVGWRVHAFHGRIDEDTTWSRTLYLLSTDLAYCAAECYDQILH